MKGEYLSKFKLKSGLNLNYELKGSGPAVVCLHGLTGGLWYWNSLANYLSKNYKFLLIDLKGHGQSDAPDDTSYLMTDLVNEIHELIEGVIGGEKFTLCGHSMGGMIAITYITTPELANNLNGLILCATSAGLRGDAANSPAQRLLDPKSMNLFDFKDPKSAKMMANMLFHRSFKRSHPDIFDYVVKKSMKTSPSAVLECFKSIAYQHSKWDLLKSINVPALILTGDKDTSLKGSKEMHEIIPNSNLKILEPKIGHMLMFEKEDEFNETISEFLNSIHGK